MSIFHRLTGRIAMIRPHIVVINKCMNGDLIPGGKGDNTDPLSLDHEQLRKGVKVEMEHTDDPNISSEIALDHLTEDPRYYSKLKKAGLADELDDEDDGEKKKDATRLQMGCGSIGKVKRLADFAKFCKIEISYESKLSETIIKQAMPFIQKPTESILMFEEFSEINEAMDRNQLIGRILGVIYSIRDVIADPEKLKNHPVLQRIENFFDGKMVDMEALSKMQDAELERIYKELPTGSYTYGMSPEELGNTRALNKDNNSLITVIATAISRSISEGKPARVFEAHSHARRYFDGRMLDLSILHKMDEKTLTLIASKFVK